MVAWDSFGLNDFELTRAFLALSHWRHSAGKLSTVFVCAASLNRVFAFAGRLVMLAVVVVLVVVEWRHYYSTLHCLSFDSIGDCLQTKKQSQTGVSSIGLSQHQSVRIFGGVASGNRLFVFLENIKTRNKNGTCADKLA